jgi:hypothetical protein
MKTFFTKISTFFKKILTAPKAFFKVVIASKKNRHCEKSREGATTRQSPESNAPVVTNDQKPTTNNQSSIPSLSARGGSALGGKVREGREGYNNPQPASLNPAPTTPFIPVKAGIQSSPVDPVLTNDQKPTTNNQSPVTPVIPLSASSVIPAKAGIQSSPVDPVLTNDQQPETNNQFPPITLGNFYKHPIFWARFLGYAIPLGFLLYVLYINYLPFGYHKTFTINVGSANDTTPSEFYLEPSKDLSDRMTNPDGTTYRTLNGMATAVFKPNVVLKNANISVEVKGGDGISLIPPTINFDPNSVKWDYNWDFTKGVPDGLLNDDKKAFAFDGGTYFDGETRLELPKSSNLFDNGPFTVYAEWMPTDSADDGQQIIGHFNWEIWQNKENVQFRIGRMSDPAGSIYSISYPIDKDFFNVKHKLIAIYDTKNNYMLLYIDGIIVGENSLDHQQILANYGIENLSFGWTTYNYKKYSHFTGKIFNAKIVNKNLINTVVEINSNDNQEDADIPVSSRESIPLSKIVLHVQQKTNKF